MFSEVLSKYRSAVLAQEGIEEADIELIKKIKNLPHEKSARLINEIENCSNIIIGNSPHQEVENTAEEEATSKCLNYKEEFGKAFSRPQVNAIEEITEPPGPGPIINPDRYRNKVQQDIQNNLKNEPAPEKRLKRIPRKIWEKKYPMTRKFLEEQYHGRCQICDLTFLKRNVKPYFEGFHIVPRTRARWIDHRGNALCLCPTCCAKFIYGPPIPENIVQQIEALCVEKEGGDGILKVDISLCGEKCHVRFTERHLIALQELLKTSG